MKRRMTLIGTALAALATAAPLALHAQLPGTEEPLWKTLDVSYFARQEAGELAWQQTSLVAAEAALEQIETFLRGAWEGRPRVILPARCRANTPAGPSSMSTCSTAA